MPEASASNPLVTTLTLPDRYERLSELLSVEVAQLLVPPAEDVIKDLESIAAEVDTRKEGVLIPLLAESGAGKTTFVMNCAFWAPERYASTLSYEGEVTYDDLCKALEAHAGTLPADNQRIIPINIDHRESAPPSDQELANIKRFLRTNPVSAPCVVFWPDTSGEIAEDIGRRYVKICGPTSIDLPLRFSGPPQDAWQSIATTTLELCNELTGLEDLGVDPKSYLTGTFPTIGLFLRKISHDFNEQIRNLRNDFEKPLVIAIAFVSETGDPGVLSQLTNPSRYGLIDGHSLIAVTANSDIGKWWSTRKGLLTRVIVQLSVHAYCVPPSVSASCVRNMAEDMAIFDDVGYRRYGPKRAVRDLRTSDIGKFVIGKEMHRYEARGNPAPEAKAAFQLLSEQGFNLGGDKPLNHVMAAGLGTLLKEETGNDFKITAEEALPFCALIPDNAIYYQDRILCIEYTWRKGDFLKTTNRSTTAQYILTKCKNYATQLGWVE